MALFKHKTHQHVVLMDEKAEKPWARFIDGIFETDDKKVIERLKTLPDVEAVEPPAESDEKAADGQQTGQPAS